MNGDANSKRNDDVNNHADDDEKQSKDSTTGNDDEVKDDGKPDLIDNPNLGKDISKRY